MQQIGILSGYLRRLSVKEDFSGYSLDKNIMESDIGKNIMKYSSISSLSYREHDFIKVLKKDFSSFKDYKIIDRKECLYIDKGSPITIMAHIDRIPVRSYKTTIDEKGRVVGQLDNLISVVACYELAKNNANYNFLFTTHEEGCDNYEQILDYMKEFPEKKIFDLDIDINIDENLMRKGCVTSSIFETKNAFKIFKESLLKSKMIFKYNPHWNIAQIGMATRMSRSKINYDNLCLLGIPVLNLHSNEEVCYIVSVENMVKLLRDYVK